MNHKSLCRKLAAIMLCSTVMLCGCSAIPEKVSMSDPIENPTNGLYVLTSNGEYYAANKYGENFSGKASSGDAKRIVSSINNAKFVPEVYENDNIVYFSKNGIPSIFMVERFRDTGNSIGLTGLSKGTDGKYYFNNKSLVANSDAYTKLSNIGKSSAAILTVNGNELTDDMVSEAGNILGLETDKPAHICYLVGTYYGEADVNVDTRIWYSSSTGSIGTYYTTKNGYIVLELPENIKDEYVSIDNNGLIHINSTTREEAE